MAGQDSQRDEPSNVPGASGGSGAPEAASGAPARFKDLALDGLDHQALADWWCAAIGYVRKWPRDAEGVAEHDPVPIVDPAGSGPLIWLNRVPERKTLKNRMHLDVYGSTERLLRLGATLVRERDADIEWDVLADIEGNEFCVFVPRGEQLSG
ncbi:VOC family protein [Streptomyces sp. NPDC003077]|uniref:VOC family protein n=1 Tax=Streptomyces sp. NPDC003077 TaxID=3154443 RepID=UPI0033B33967